MALELAFRGLLQQPVSLEGFTREVVKVWKMDQHTLRLILGDQLNSQHSWFTEPKTHATYVLMEVHDEATYVTHHIQKVAAFFLAMRAFAQQLSERGFSVRYIQLDDPNNQQALDRNIEALLVTGEYSSFEYQSPDEYRVSRLLKELESRLSVPTREVPSEHFLTDQRFFSEVFSGHKRYIMESFYRAVRRRYGFLIEDGAPLGGAWNFDAENRNKLPASVTPPAPLLFHHSASHVAELLQRMNVKTIGALSADQTITYPITRTEALECLDYFCEKLLPSFGVYQDAMHSEHRFLFHSRLSFALNVKLLSPKEVLERAIDTWRKDPQAISIAQIEGFVRQIAGWREFIRGVYWAHMPEYKELNFFSASRTLPHYFWSSETRMACIRHAVTQSLEDAYAHHIQRLMITGNFALLAGLNPDEVDAWYLGIYADAVEWVQLPNTRGMSQFADGGIVGTKPYAASANYINKMSNYCSGCAYNYKARVGTNACPFNSLYWDFMIRHREQLEKNPRIGMVYRSLDKMDAQEITDIRAQARNVLDRIESL